MVDRGALAGSGVAGMFGTAWSLWGASGLTGTAATVVRVVGIAIGVLILVAVVILGRSLAGGRPRSGPGSMFASRAYQMTVAVEVLAFFGGNLLLRAIGHSEYVPVWVATVVGFHFLVFGRKFWAGFYLVGAALLVAAAAGLVVGLSGGGQHSITAVCGLLAALSLFAAGAVTIARSLTQRAAAV
ncbi:hypothetical protein ABIB25_004370 [Nakamurella sp. UYEF19]|uniref:hypothetical protein n=1 Tax=Nakamurella sp. UYEF19 TaxID=1756392 RepID=UPI003390EC5A